MSADLPPFTRVAAAIAASRAWREYDNTTLYVSEEGRWRYVADAVTVVVAEKIERQLQEKIEYWRQRWESRNEHFDLISRERDALQTRVELLTAALTRIGERTCEAVTVIGRTCDQRGPHAAKCGVCTARAALTEGSKR